MANVMTLIQKVVVTNTSVASINFSNIPQTYTDLKLVISARNDFNGTYCGFTFTFNGGSQGNIYSSIRALGSGSGTYTGFDNNTSYGTIATGQAAQSTANTFGSYEMYIPNYTGSTNKSWSTDQVTENNATEAYAQIWAGIYANTSAITSITLADYTGGGGNMVQYTTASLYGVTKQDSFAPVSASPYATGGDSITFDGTYWIHTFRTSGTFTPRRALSNVDYLVVAGGGGGGRNNGGGGGAGGLRCTVGASGGGGSPEPALSLTSGTAYSVIVGAGGVGQTGTSPVAATGSNSIFATITSNGGGGGGGYNGSAYTNGFSGGSGGGSSGSTGNTGGAGISAQGFAGGNASSSGDEAGGGGGSGTAGAVGASSSPGSGGSGLTLSISGTSTVYGGGGGGGQRTVAGSTALLNNGGTGGGGSGAQGTSGTGFAGSSGTTNTGGGGGGGSRQDGNGGNGGSGIVIVRYRA